MDSISSEEFVVKLQLNDYSFNTIDMKFKKNGPLIPKASKD